MMRSGITKHRRRGRHGRLLFFSPSFSFSLAHLALIIDDVPAARSLPSPSIRFSSSYSLMNGRFSILFLLLSLHVILPRNRPGDRSRLPALASPIARSSIEETRESLLFLLREHETHVARGTVRHHVARSSRSIHVDHRQGSAARAKLRGLLSPFPVSVHLRHARYGRANLLRWRRDEIIRNDIHRLTLRQSLNQLKF